MEKIAIIGTSGLFPGSSSPEAFWENLMAGKDLTGIAALEDFGADPAVFFHPEKGMIDQCYSLRGGYIRDFQFSPEGYHLPADYLARLDKLYQWPLFVAADALRDAGYVERKDLLRRCGLVLGNLSFPTGSSHRQLASLYTETINKALCELLQAPGLKLPATQLPVPDNYVLEHDPAVLVSRALGLGSTHYTLDAACATSLYAIRLACDELLTGKADLMLAGAVCASDQLFIHMGFSIFHAYAPADAPFIPLDKHSAGLVSSEGAGMVVLKRLSDAERDGDQILGVIGGIGLSNDGRGKFLLSPHPKGQRLAFERAYTMYEGVSPTQTSYLECHATGTPLGDQTEINSIADFFSLHQVKPLLGSVKSNMGHLLTAAGMTGLLKVLLAMQRETIPPNINLQEGLSSDNGWMGPEQMIQSATPWPGRQRQAGINSFGFGGTNAHMIVQQYVQGNPSPQPFVPQALLPMAITGMDAHFGDCSTLHDFYATLFYGRQHFKSLPEQRWKGFDADAELLKKYGFPDGQPPRGAYIEDFDIDLLRYKIQPREAETLEPQQALILKVADNAIKDAGLSESRNVAVLIAMESELAIHHYLARWDLSWQLRAALEQSGLALDPAQEAQLEDIARNAIYYREGSQTPSQHTSFVGNIMSSRIAALWDFSGPAFTVSCGENAVFKALDIAQNMLSLGEVEAVVVGGVDFSGGLESVLLRHRREALNPAAKPSLAYNIHDRGWLIGEGAGAIVLQRHADARADKVYAVLDKPAAAEGLSEATVVELAATGMHADEQEELAWLQQQSSRWPVALGSVKANIGHTFAASGIAAVIKSALCLHHRFIPGIPNWQGPREASIFGESRYYFPEQSRPWILEAGQEERVAMVRAQDGTLLRLREGQRVQANPYRLLQDEAPALFILKGDGPEGLLRQLSALDIAVETGAPLQEIAARFYRNARWEEPFALVIIAATGPDILQEMAFFRQHLAKAWAEGRVLKTPRGSYCTPHPVGAEAKLAFVYPGSSTAYAQLGESVFQLFPSLYAHFEQQLPALYPYIWPEYLYPKKQAAAVAGPVIYDNAIAMMSVGVFFSAAYTHILRHHLGINPDIAFGYSMGECSSMWYALGVWAPDEAREFQESPIFRERFAGDLALLAEHWGVHSAEAKNRWVSLVLQAPREAVLALMAEYEQVYLSFINSEKELVISGDRNACMAIADRLGCRPVQIPFQNIIHHDFCTREREGLLKMHQFPVQERPAIDFYSSISGGKIALDSRLIAENSTAVCCQAVDFPGTVNTVYAAGARLFIEVGAQATCTRWIGDILEGRPHVALSIDQKGKSTLQSLMELLAQLISHGRRPDVSFIFPAVAEQAGERQFMKKITPGGQRLFAYLLQDEHRVAFSDIRRSRPAFVDQEEEVSTTIMIEKISTATPAVGRQVRLGENGLRLQDYASGEQLQGKEIIFTQEDLEEFATGKIARVFGPDYAIIDTYPRRVMLPMHPYLLVSRVTGLRGKLGEYKPSWMQTEYDIPYDAWFTTDRQIPWAVSVESGQCDLMLISYLGIDLQNKGELVYRLLDCTLTFVDDLPFEGQTLRYDISINSYVRNGDNLLFFFSYLCYVEDRLVLKMDGGCAGFFTYDQLQEGNGVIYTDKEVQARLTATKRHFTPLLRSPKTSFSKEDLRHLIRGDMEKCFDDISYYANGRNPSLRLPPEQILMLDRITRVDIHGGAYGLGYIEAEKDLHADDWYFPCHFRDDEVLAGSLQAEGGGNLLRFFMLLLGLQRLTKDARYQPVFDLPQKVRCRKEVTPKDTKLVYKLEIKEIGLIPNPYVIGDLEIISEGVVTVHFENLGLQLREKSNPRYLEQEAGVKISPRSAGALLNERDITTFALDDLSKCFGPEFAVYDGRTVSRQPNTDLQLISRVLKIDGQRHDFSRPTTIWAEYDVPADAWYYQQNASMTMPYAILMEIALQPCGLLGAYLGSTLQFADKNLFFRNLDGEGEMLDLPMGTDFRGKTISNRSVLVSSVALGGTIIQNYTFELSVDGQVFYRGKSSFGFFPGDALASQAGLDNGKEVAPWYETQGLREQDYRQINLNSPYGRLKLFTAPAGKPHWRLSDDQLRLLDKLIIAPGQGQHGQGYIHATRFMQPYDWFFTCHFYQDPVMPGSLGVEAILQAMQVYALQQDLGAGFVSPRFVQLPGHRTQWKYRGQILTNVKEMHLEVHIKALEQRGQQRALIADACLWNGGMRIYQVTDLALGIEEQTTNKQ